MATGDDAAPGNWGLHDQILAMRFVQDNIEQFGGDKDKVTIFGQSAGAASATLHMVIPESYGKSNGYNETMVVFPLLWFSKLLKFDDLCP